MRTQMEPRRLRANIERTFAHRDTHPMPEQLAPPPESWRALFEALAALCGIEIELDRAVRTVDSYVRSL